MDFATLRSLVGSDRFDAAIASAKTAEDPTDEDLKQAPIDEMESEPGNDGLTLEEGRDALKRAADRDVDLPPPSVLFKR